MEMTEFEGITIEVVYALPEEQQLVTVSLPAATRARDALTYVLDQKLVVLEDSDSAPDSHSLPIGVFGISVADDYVLKNGDRLEIYRPLLQDPKERRRKIAEQNSTQ